MIICPYTITYFTIALEELESMIKPLATEQIKRHDLVTCKHSSPETKLTLQSRVLLYQGSYGSYKLKHYTRHFCV